MQDEVILKNYRENGSDKEPHYFQRIAIHKSIEAIANPINAITIT